MNTECNKKFEKYMKSIGNETKLRRNDYGEYREPATRLGWKWFKVGYNNNTECNKK